VHAHLKVLDNNVKYFSMHVSSLFRYIALHPCKVVYDFLSARGVCYAILQPLYVSFYTKISVISRRYNHGFCVCHSVSLFIRKLLRFLVDTKWRTRFRPMNRALWKADDFIDQFSPCSTYIRVPSLIDCELIIINAFR
jgi:hypothetical protein